MHRRRYLALLGTTGLAGCSGSSPSDGGGGANTATDTPPPTATETPAPTDTPTATADSTPTTTPEPSAPQVQFVTLVSSWEEFGDATANQIDARPQGSDIAIAYRYDVWVHDGTHDITAQVEILDQQENRVAIDQYSDEQFVDGSGMQEWEGWIGFRATWDPGTYTAEVIVRDNVTDKTSEPETGTFEITEPEPKLEIISENRYSDEFDAGIRGVARNVADETLSYAEVSAVFLDAEGRQVGDGLDNTENLAAGREWQFDVPYLGDGDFASYELSVDWSVA